MSDFNIDKLRTRIVTMEENIQKEINEFIEETQMSVEKVDIIRDGYIAPLRVDKVDVVVII